jgi:C_GCAxxG_C_C family probable redox protein
MSEFTQLAKDYYKSGLSCSEAVIKTAIDSGIYKSDNIEELHRIASMFSAGMSSGCLCGAVAASQIVLGGVFGRNISENKTQHREIAAEFIQKFKEQRKATCCKVLSAPYANNPAERKQNCINIVEESAQILEDIVTKYLQEKINV